MGRLSRGIVAAVVAAVLAAGCGSDDDTPRVTQATSTPTDETATPSPEPTAAATPDPSPTEQPSGTDGDDGGEADDDGESEDPTPTAAIGLEGPAFTADSKLTTAGLDEIFFGMSPADAAEAADTAWVGIPTPPERCYQITPVNGPDGITFTVFDGFIERVDITTDLITTRSGAGLGTTEAELAELFPENLFPVPLDDGGNSIQFVSSDEADREFRIVFVTDGTTVTEMHAGRIPVVLEGCS